MLCFCGVASGARFRFASVFKFESLFEVKLEREFKSVNEQES